MSDLVSVKEAFEKILDFSFEFVYGGLIEMGFVFWVSLSSKFRI